MSMLVNKVTQGPPVTPVAGSAGQQEATIQDVTPVSAQLPETDANDAKKKEQAPGINNEDIEKAVEQFNAASEYFGHQIKLQVHEETQRYKIDIIDKDTQQVIGEFPPEEILDLVARFKDMMGVVISGLFLDKKV